MKKHCLIALAICLLAACAPSPQPIDFGNDVCSHCKMSIVDQQHAAELVTSKGKVFKFDAIECMVDFLKANQTTTYSFYLVRDFNQPGEWQDALTSHYLVSEAIPSPMGANLSAFMNEKSASEMQSQKGGVVYAWEELKGYLK